MNTPRHDERMVQAREIVFRYAINHLDPSDPPAEFSMNDVYVVWFSKVLKNYKVLVSTNLPDGRYYEVTYNGQSGEAYLDVYVKVHNEAVQVEV